MKKLLFFLAALMFVASCAKDTTTTPEVKGEKVVSFKVTAPKIQTRYGEGAEANKLFWAVYKNGQRLDDISVIDPAEAVAINMSVDVEISLMEGIDYDILFWAQNENAPYTFDGAKVTIDYNALSANKEAYDAFFRNYHVDADQTEPHRVELRRPFAQLNIGTADTAKAQSAGFTLENTSVTVEACTVLDLATGEASEPQELTFAMSQKASDTYGDEPDTFDIISMNYLLVNNEKKVVDVTFNAEGGNDAIEREYLNVPLQRNHRTYILGDILTSSKLFNVYINPAFDDEDLFPREETIFYYTSYDGQPVWINEWIFDEKLVENIYENGQGKATFEGKITVIKCEAFRGSYLTSIIIPNSVTKIEDSAFYYCPYLESVTIPDSVTEISVSMFGECPNLESFDCQYATSDKRCLIKDNKLYAFAPAGLTSYTIPDGVTEIGGWAFYYCTNLTEVIIPESVKVIGKYAFENCVNLTSITIPSGVTEVGPKAFPSGITAFYGDLATSDNRALIVENKLVAFISSGLSTYVIPDGVTSIGDNVFEDCSGFTSITIPNSVTSIGDYAFSDCSGLKELIIPEGVTSIGKHAFSDCSGLTSLTIPSSVKTIGNYAFDDCSGLQELIIPEGVTSIGENAFGDCSGLTSLTIPSSVKTIGNYAFSNCSGLQELIIPEGVESIGSNAFYQCSGLTSLTIPSSVESIQSYAFSYCSKLSTIYCKSTTPPTPGYEYDSVWAAFSENAPDFKIYVPTESLDAYKNADGWKDYKDCIVDGGF